MARAQRFSRQPAQRGDRCLPVGPVEFHELVGSVAAHADPLVLVVEQRPVGKEILEALGPVLGATQVTSHCPSAQKR